MNKYFDPFLQIMVLIYEPVPSNLAYPNEHAARIKDPKYFDPDTYRRTEGGLIYGKIKVPKTISIIWAKLKGHSGSKNYPIPQALRFPVKNWTAAEAKKWLKDNHVKYILFEPAKSGGKNMETKFSLNHNSTLEKNEPDWGNVDKTKLPRAAFARKGEANKKSTWGFPHHWVKGGGKTNKDGIYTDGTMYLHRGGLAAAWAAANGGRSGQKAEASVLHHLNAHRKAVGMGEEKKGKEAEESMVQSQMLEKDPCLFACTGADHISLFAEADGQPKDNIRLHLYDGKEKNHWYWGKLIFDLKTMHLEKLKVPILDAHVSPIGYSTKASFDGGFTLEGKFLKNNALASARKDEIEQGVPYEASFRFEPSKTHVEEIPDGETVIVNGEEFRGPGKVMRNVPIKEGSTCLFGALENCKTESFIKERNNAMAKEPMNVDVLAEEHPEIYQEVIDLGADNARQELAEMQKAFPKDLAFVVEQFIAGSSLQDAKAAYADVLTTRNAELEKQNKFLREHKGDLASAGEGVTSQGEGDAAVGAGNFIEIAKERAKRDGINVTAAMKIIAQENPELPKKYKASLEKQRMDQGETRRVAS
jgi:hypothetical protein